MKTKHLTIALIGLSLISTVAHAGEINDWYVSGAIGLTKTADVDFNDTGTTGEFSIDNTVNFSVAAGKNLSDKVRAELEISHRNADISNVAVDGVGSASASGEIKTSTVMLNGYYTLASWKSVSPYVTAGLGIAHHKGDLDAIGGIGIPNYDASDNVFAYKLGFGSDFTVNDSITAFADYRYAGTSDPDLDGLKAEYDAHEIRAGIRYGF